MNQSFQKTENAMIGIFFKVVQVGHSNKFIRRILFEESINLMKAEESVLLALEKVGNKGKYQYMVSVLLCFFFLM